QLAVLESGPAHEGDGDNLVSPQKLPQCVVKIFVEQHLHGLGWPRRAWANSIRRLIWETDKEGKPSRSSSIVSPRSKLSTIASGIMRVPRTMGRPDTLPGTFSISSQAIQSMSKSASAFAMFLPSFHRDRLPETEANALILSYAGTHSDGETLGF